MEHKPALYALIRLHADLGGRIKQNAKEATKLRTVEAVLKLLQPDFNARRIAARRKNNPNPLFKRGTIFRAVLDVLRAAPKPMTVEEIGVALFRSKGVLEPAKAERERMYGAVNASLENHLGKSVARDEGRPRRWRINAT